MRMRGLFDFEGSGWIDRFGFLGRFWFHCRLFYSFGFCFDFEVARWIDGFCLLIFVNSVISNTCSRALSFEVARC